VIVYDITNEESFLAVNKWRKEFLKSVHEEEHERFPIVLIGKRVF